MKTHARIKKLNSLFTAIAALSVLYFASPKVLASQPYPTNNWQFANGQQVPINQVTNIIQPQFDPAKSDTPKQNVLGLIIAFMIAIVVIGYILYQICKMLDKVIPPPEKKPDPPPGSPTNSPPITINPTTAPRPITANLKMDTRSGTNSSWSIQPYDITGLHYVNCMEKGMNFDTFWSTGMMTSTNLTDWEDTHYQIDCYVTSSVGVLYVYRHYGTNFYNAYFTADFLTTNKNATAYFNLTDKPYRAVQFFKLDPKS